MFSARAGSTPWNRRLSGTSSRLPVRVCGTPGTAITSSGTCRGLAVVRIAVRISSTNESLSSSPGASCTNSGIQ